MIETIGGESEEKDKGKKSADFVIEDMNKSTAYVFSKLLTWAIHTSLN